MMDDKIYRQQAIDAMKEHRALYCDNTPDTFSKLSYAEKSRVDELDTAIATLVNLPSVQPEYEPVTAKDFAKTMSENTVYQYMVWYGMYLALMKEQGVVICKKM